MRGIGAVALGAAFLVGSAASAEKAPCPPREAGQAYPWQNLEPIKGDHYAWVIVDIDKTGRAIRCGIGENNIPDPETRFRLCNAYSEDWRGPPASASDPAIRTIKRHFTMIGYEHQMADQKARKAWFRAHPEERSECYPE
jgi:hypothetical protein